MFARLHFSLRQSAWLLVLLIITSALPAHAQDDEPYLFDPAEDGSGYIMRPRPYVSYDPGVLVVPAVRESDGIPIVGVDGFSYQERLLALIFEGGSQVKYIGSFQGCTGIEFIDNMPATVEKIGDYAFQGCERLRDVTLNDGLKYIGISCFEGCTSLTKIKLPASLKVLRENAFRVCTGLQSVEFDDNINFYDGYSYGFYNNVFDGCESLHTVKLPKNSPDGFIIPTATFSWCPNLKSIEFPANTKRIDQMAFYRSGIENLDLTTITSDKIYVEGYYTFAACENLKSVTANGNFQFSNTSLYTFQDCKALETVTINGSGDDFIAITPDAFRWCDNLKSVKVYRLKGTGDVNNEMDSVFVGCKSLKEVISTSTCPPELNKIGHSCFDGCESLETVTLPKKEFKINTTAFRGCAALQSLDLANVTSIGTKAFNGCGALTSISINNLPTMEKDDAFDEWHFANTEIAVPDEKYRTFTSDAYWGKFSNFKHPSLFAYTEVPGGYSVSKSPYALEADFTGMLEIPAKYNSSNVVAVAEGAFQGFTNLTGVTLPEGLKTIGSNAFAGCTGIKTVNNMCTEAITGDGVCPENIFDASVYGAATLYVPFGCYDAFSNYAPWKNFSTIKQGFGERTLNAPTASPKSGDFNWSFDLTLTNPNEVGSIYYYIVSEGEAGNVGYQTFPYQHPITIPAKTCTVWTYVSDGVNCSEPVSFEYTYVRLATDVGLDKVLSANFGDRYFIGTNLYGHYHDGIYLYASTMGNSGSSKNTFNVDKKTEWWSDKEGDFNQEDWVAVSGLSNEYVGQQIESGSLATVGPNTNYPVISFSGSLKSTPATMGINTFRVANFNIHAESAAVNNIWLVAPQPAEYCTVTGYVDINKMHITDGYLVLQSAKGPTETTIKDENTGVETTILIDPLTMNVYYNNATNAVDHTGWYAFTGIVSKEGEALKFTALSVDEKPTGVEGVDSATARVFAANGNINIIANTQSAIAVYSANGQLVTAVEAVSATIAVAPGFYIVKVGNQVTKLAVK